MVRPTPLEGFDADVASDGAIVRLLHPYALEPVHDLASDGSGPGTYTQETKAGILSMVLERAANSVVGSAAPS